MHVFNFSEDDHKKTKRQIRMLLLFGVPVVFIAILIISDFNYIRTITVCIITYLFSNVVAFVNNRVYSKIHCQDKILIDDREIIKQDKQEQRQIVWDNIAKIEVTMDFKGDVALIKLYEKNNTPAQVYGFNNMDRILNLISDKVSDSKIIQTNRRKLNYENPFVLLIICWGVSVPIFLVLIFVGKYFWGTFTTAANEYLIHPLIKFIFGLLCFDL